jgi:TRAP-type mannitol/chloroaromatic compound transport system permease small subunit
MGFFAGLVSWKIWALVLDSFESGIRSSTYLLTPQWIPEGILGVGFTLLAVASAAMGLALVVERASGGARVQAEDVSQSTWRAGELRAEARDRC